MSFPKTNCMPMKTQDGKKCNLPAGGARVGNVQSKSGLPTKPSGANTNVGSSPAKKPF